MAVGNRLHPGLPSLWLVILMATASQMGGAAAGQGLSPLYPFLQKELALTRAQVGLISSAIMGGGLATTLPLGWLADRAGARWVMSVALLVTAVFLLLFSQVHYLAQALALGVAASMAEAAMYPGSAKVIMDWVPPRARGVAMSIKQTGVPLGGVLAAAILPTLAVAFGWRVAVVVLALVVTAIGAAFIALYRDAPRAPGAVGGRPGFLKTLPMVARNRDILVCALLAAILVGLQFVVMTYLILFLTESLFLSVVVAGGFLAIAQVSSFGGRILWGAVSDFFLGGRRVVVLALIGALSAIAFVLLAVLPPGAPGVVVGVLVVAVGATVLAWHGVYTVLVAELGGPGLTGISIGYSSIIMRAGGVALPPLFGLVADATGSYTMSWWMAAGLAGAGTSLLLLLRPASWRR